MKSYTTISRYFLNRINYLKHKLFDSKKIITGDNGIKYLIVPGSSLDHIIKNNGFLDDWKSLQKLEEFIPKDGIIFDIGANVGHLSLPFAKKFIPKGELFAYEPDPENIIQLQENIKLNGLTNITNIATALQDNEKISHINFNIRRTIDGDGNENRGLSSIKNINKFKKETLSVKASTLDNEVKRLNVKNIDLIKIDVEGAEHLVLEGGSKSIKKWHPIIQYEYSNVLDKIMNEDNTIKTFTFLKNLDYRQFYANNNNEIIEIKEPNTEMSDVNIISFHKDKVPNFFITKQ